MNDDGRVYFIGAGASEQDMFPLTGELKHGLAWAIREEPERYAILAKHLEYLYHVSDKTFEKSADIWENLASCFRAMQLPPPIVQSSPCATFTN